MSRRLLVPLALALVVAACNGNDAELTTSSTIVTGPSATDAPASTTSTSVGDVTSPTGTSVASEPVGSYQVVSETTNDDGVARDIVIPEGGYTDVDLENFIYDLLDAYPDLYGAEIFDSADAADAFAKAEADRTDADQALLDRHHLVSLVGRDRFVFRGPFSDVSGGAIGS